MNQKEFYKKYIRPYLRVGSDLDRPYNRSLYADVLDQCNRDGLVTDKQAQNWVYPNNDYFESKEQRRARCKL